MTHLAVVPQVAVFRGADGLRTIDAYFAQIEALAGSFSRVTLCARVEDGAGGDRRLEGVDMAELPPYASRSRLALMVPEYHRRIRAALRDADLTLVVLPGYLGAMASWICRRDHLPHFHFVVGRWGRVVVSRRLRGLGGLQARVVAPVLDAAVTYLTRDALTFHNAGLPPRAPAYHHVRISSTVVASDLRRADSVMSRRGAARLIYAGRFSAEKGLAVLLRAVALLREDGHSVELDLVGDGEERATLEKEAVRLGLGAAVRFTGWIPRGGGLRERYDRADVFVLPSYEDMAPRVLLEAMARRLPVVATAVGHVPRLVRDGDTGLLVEPGSPGAIADAVLRLLKDPDLRSELISNGAALAAEHTLEAETARTISIVRRHFSLADPEQL